MNDSSTRTIMLIDDSKVSRMFARDFIQQLHPAWRIVEAGTGEEGLQMLDSVAPDLVILDVNMPGIGGLATASLMRGQQPSLPICILTANIQSATRLRAEGLDVDFAEKPVTRERIAGILALLERG
ncbi:response regulator [Pseudoduganella sp. OTU4001]|uniref:response regulator n=1 Tax=Pseudoduganella sp. OTU4001 TaxID=3043854 RepID=UPI00313CFDBD